MYGREEKWKEGKVDEKIKIEWKKKIVGLTLFMFAKFKEKWRESFIHIILCLE